MHKTHFSRISITGIIRLLFALLIVIGSLSFLGPCVHTDGSQAPCVSSSHWQIILGSVMVALSLVYLWCGNKNLRKWLAISLTLIAIVTALVPGTLVSLCMMNSMRCNAIMKPSIQLISAFVALLSLVDVCKSAAKGDKSA